MLSFVFLKGHDGRSYEQSDLNNERNTNICRRRNNTIDPIKGHTYVQINSDRHQQLPNSSSNRDISATIADVYLSFSPTFTSGSSRRELNYDDSPTQSWCKK